MATKKKTAALASPSHDSRMPFIQSVKFAGLGMDNANLSIDRLALANLRTKKKTVNTEVDIKQSVLIHQDDFFVVAADFVLTQQAKGGGSDLLSIKARFSALFRLTEPATKEAVDQFAKLEARLVFFPYLRHFVSDTTYRMAIDPIVLPMTSEL